MIVIDEIDVIDIQPQLQMIVNAIVKAIGYDTRNYLVDGDLDTNNAIILLRGDFINTNLRDMVVAENDNLELKHFKRFVWTGNILIDHKHKLTTTISATSTLKRIKGVKERKNPHYLQSICHVLNGDLEAECKQLSLFYAAGEEFDSLFTEAVYEDDFENIADTAINLDDGYRHCVITYEVEHYEVKSISLLILDKDLDVVRNISLMDLLQPDFSTLTAQVTKEENAPKIKDAHSLVKLKEGLKSRYANEPGMKPEISSTQEGSTKQA